MTETTTATPAEIEAATLAGDLRDMILAEFKAVTKPWQQMSEEDQDRYIHRARDIAETCVRSSVDIIAAKGLPSLPIEVGKITVDGSACKGAFECYADDDALLRIRHLQGSRAMFVLASPAAYHGERETPKADPDQPALPIAESGDQPRADEAQLAQVGRGKRKNGKAAEAAGNEPAPDIAQIPVADASRPFADDGLPDIPPEFDRRGERKGAA